MSSGAERYCEAEGKGSMYSRKCIDSSLSLRMTLLWNCSGWNQLCRLDSDIPNPAQASNGAGPSITLSSPQKQRPSTHSWDMLSGNPDTRSL